MSIIESKVLEVVREVCANKERANIWPVQALLITDNLYARTVDKIAEASSRCLHYADFKAAWRNLVYTGVLESHRTLNDTSLTIPLVEVESSL